MRRRKFNYGIIVFITLIIVLVYTTYTYTSSQGIIKSAKELKISANELGEGWEGSFSYMDNPIKALKEFCKAIERLSKNATDENTLKEEKNLLEIVNKLKECNVKDGYILILKKVKSPKTLAEVDVFVFNGVDGAREFFKYMKGTERSWETLKIGGKTVFCSTSAPHVLLGRVSNAVIRVIVWDERDTGTKIMEKILNKK